MKLSKKDEEKLRQGLCPVCGCSSKWLFGPRGGCAVTIMCDNCRTEFVIYPFGAEVISDKMSERKMKTKPLDLEGINKKAFEFFCEMLFDTKHPRDISEWSDIGKIGGEHGIDAEEIEEIVDFVTDEIKQCIKQACKFYLRYKDNPELLMKERDKEYLYLKELCPSYEGKDRCKVEHTLCRFPGCIWFSVKNIGKDISMEQYNEWLFKLVFKDIFKQEG